jgi:adenylosuccinate lyase
VAAVLARREKGAGDDDLLQRLAADDRLHLSRSELEATVADPVAFTGAAAGQVAAFVRNAEDLAAGFPDAAGYRPAPIL